jgi:hypothetical protein
MPFFLDLATCELPQAGQTGWADLERTYLIIPPCAGGRIA